MGIPIIAENLFNSLANTVESGFDYETRGKAGSVLSKGLHAMDMLTSAHRTAPEYCRAELISYIHKIADENLKSSYNTAEAATHTLLKICSIIAKVAFVISILLFIPFVVFAYKYQGGFNAFLDSWSDGNGRNVFYGLTGVLAVSILLIIVHKIIGTALKKRHKSEADRKTEKEIDVVSYNDLLEYAATHDWIISDASRVKKYCNDLCERLNLDPFQFDVDFGKATGGGSTWVGWGSGAAIGGGLALSALSKLSANSKNASINKRIEQLEAIVFYNNIAMYFNNNIMSKLLSSQPELKNKMPIDLVN